jgi:hypothetical protein
MTTANPPAVWLTVRLWDKPRPFLKWFRRGCYTAEVAGLEYPVYLCVRSKRKLHRRVVDVAREVRSDPSLSVGYMVVG